MKAKVSLIIFLFFTFSCFAQSNLINRLDNKDIVFKEYIKKVNESFKLYAQKKIPSVQFYVFYGDEKMDFMSLCARCNLRQETVATINRISNPSESLAGKKLILPTANGIFIPKNAKTALEGILKKKCFSFDKTLCYNVNGSEFQFIPDEKFSPTERAFFLDVLMRSPLPEGVITSDYGIRKSPISGKEHFHGGLDLAAPHGTNVLACKSGVVLQTGFDSELGNFIIINHDSKNQSLYAHLSEILKKTGDFVTSGTVIGKVGSTGASTGPHLHFEIRSGGKKINPRSVIR